MDSERAQFELKEDFPFSFFRTTARQSFLHSHDCLEINYIEFGSGYYIIENKTYPVQSGDIFIINNAERHMAVHESIISMQVFIFDTKLIWNQWNDDYLKPFFYRNVEFSNRIGADDQEAPELTGYIKRIAKEFETQKEGWKLVLQSALLLFLAVLHRHYERGHALLQNVMQFQKSYDRIREVIEYIASHFNEHMSLEELGKTASMNKTYLSAYFKEVMKVSIVEYIEHIRVNHACMLLRTTKLPVTEVAIQSGFNGISYFNRIFKRQIGETPGEYRKSKNSKYSASLLKDDSSNAQTVLL